MVGVEKTGTVIQRGMIHAKVLSEPSRIWNVERDLRVFDNHCLGSLAVMCQIKRKAISRVIPNASPGVIIGSGEQVRRNRTNGSRRGAHQGGLPATRAHGPLQILGPTAQRLEGLHQLFCRGHPIPGKAMREHATNQVLHERLTERRKCFHTGAVEGLVASHDHVGDFAACGPGGYDSEARCLCCQVQGITSRW